METDEGDIFLTGKYRWLQRGAAALYPRLSRNAEPIKGTREIIVDDASITEAVTDPVVVCLARRAWTGRNRQPFVVNLDIPTQEEAEAELVSGKDKYGGKWPAPTLKSEAFLGG